MSKVSFKWYILHYQFKYLEIFTILVSTFYKENLIIFSLEGGCTLPEPPEKGSYSSPLCQPGQANAACNQVPGTAVAKNWVLHFQCNSGYQLPENYLYAICLDGKWSPFLPTCTSKYYVAISRCNVRVLNIVLNFCSQYSPNINPKGIKPGTWYTPGQSSSHWPSGGSCIFWIHLNKILELLIMTIMINDIL